MRLSISNPDIEQGVFDGVALRCIALDLIDEGVHEIADGIAAEYLPVIDHLAEAFEIERVFRTKFFRVMIQQCHDAPGIVDQVIFE